MSEKPESKYDSHILPMELAFIRWSVVHRQWYAFSNNCPILSAFMAGWFCRCIGATQPEDVGPFVDSFRCGWREADTMIQIERQKQK